MTAQPLHLHRGDPLPALGVDGFDIADHAGKWLLIVVVDELNDRLRDDVATAVERFGRATDVRYVAAQTHAADDVIADPDGVATRRLGALVDEDARFTIAVVVEPGGRVQASCDDTKAALAVSMALEAAVHRRR